MKRNKKWEKFRSQESNQSKHINKKHDTTSPLLELNTNISSQKLNQNSFKDTSTLIKRNYADVLVNANEIVNDGAKETKAAEKTKTDERNTADNRAGKIRIKLKGKKRKMLTWKRLTWKKYILNFCRRNIVRVLSSTNPLHLSFPPILPN